MPFTSDVYYTYDEEVAGLVASLGYGYQTLTRSNGTAYIFSYISLDDLLTIEQAGGLTYGVLYYSSESQFGW